jgi:hypothetical protein
LNFAEIIGEVIDIMAGLWSRCHQLPGVGEVAIEVTTTVGDAETGTEGEHRALIEHSAREVERYHRILQWIFDEHPYLAR